MKYHLIIDDKATFEIQEAFDYYEDKSIGLGERFIKSVEDYFEKIKNNPKQFQVKREEIREAYLQKFPFVIIYQIVEKIIIIYSVFHTSRNPSTK